MPPLQPVGDPAGCVRIHPARGQLHEPGGACCLLWCAVSIPVGSAGTYAAGSSCSIAAPQLFCLIALLRPMPGSHKPTHSPGMHSCSHLCCVCALTIPPVTPRHLRAVAKQTAMSLVRPDHVGCSSRRCVGLLSQALITRIHQDAAEAREALEQPELQSHKLDPWLLPSSHPATATTADGQHSCASTSA